MEAGFSREKLPLIVIAGPTASGKTSLAIELAQKLSGEIICADSRTVYKGMDIGTAKPTEEEQKKVPHWGLNLVEPSERFTAFDFKQYAEETINQIRARGHVPFLVGGTGLYIDAVLFDYQFGSAVDMAKRQRLEKLSIEELHSYCINNNVILPQNKLNKRYVIRAIEQKGSASKRNEIPVSSSIIVGIATDKDELQKRIRVRTEQLFDHGVVDEATLLGKKYGWKIEAMTGNIYSLAPHYLEGEITLEEYKEKVTTLDWHLAKRQLTWFKRNHFIHWGNLEEAREYILYQFANR